MNNIVGDLTGLIHLVASFAAMASGIYVFASPKGGQKHRRIGYTYVASMVILNVTAFMIYRLYGKFGLFHWLSIVSSLTIIAGMYPILTKKGKNYVSNHFSFMYWSVIGLYAAFMAEIFSRLPKFILTQSGEPMVVFYKLVGIATALVMGIGAYLFIKYYPVWKGRYERS